MSVLQKLIMDPTWNNEKLGAILNILLQNPNELKNTSRELVTKLLREALEFIFYTSNGRDIIKLIITSANLSPLDLGILQNDLSLTECLLKNGFRLDGPEWDDYSPAQYIFRVKSESKKDMLSLLVKYGLNTEFRNKNDENLFHLFTRGVYENDRDAIELAKILIKCRVPINEFSKHPFGELRTPLFNCVCYQKIELISFLIENGADVSIDMDLLFVAVHGDAKVVDLLLSTGFDVNVKNIYKSTLLHEACSSNNDPVIRLLIRKGACVRVENVDGATPFSMLSNEEDNYDECAVAIIKKISSLIIENFSVFKVDMNLINSNPKTRKHFEKCITQLELMSSTRFHNSYSYFSVLKKKNIKSIAQLTKNDEIMSKFETNLYKFSYYAEDLKEILKEASQVKDNFDAVYEILNVTLRDIFPDVVIRKLSDNLNLKDLS